MNALNRRLEDLISRLRTAYDGIGHSSGRPYVYFVYPPEEERELRRLIMENLCDDGSICYHHIDLLPLTMRSIEGQEERRQELLNDTVKGSSAATSVLRLWARILGREITSSIAAQRETGRPTVVLQGLGALHPLGNPTSLMEVLAEQEARDPKTNRIVPIVLFIPGIRPPQSSRTYLFLGLEQQRLDFYRGEEI